VFTLFGYGFGLGAPGLRDKAALHRAIHHVNLAHGGAVDALRAAVSGASIGAVHNRQPCLPASPSTADHDAAQKFAEYWNGAFPEPQFFGCYPPSLSREIEPYQQPGDMAAICRPVDWFGLNHYSPNYVRVDSENVLGFGFAGPPPDVPRTPIGWPIVPDAFADTLIEIDRRYRVPIYVLENGTASDDKLDGNGTVSDPGRIAYVKSYIEAMHRAIAAGADVRGYFVWSLLDNFEWGSGYSQRFGLVYVDYPTQRRIPKASARWYADMIATDRKSASR
jgi:beta-glucosidase